MPKRKQIFFVLILVFFAFANSQDLDSAVLDNTIKPARLALIGSGIATTYTAIYLVFLKEGWWPGGESAQKFNFERVKHDFGYASNLDKFGHFYTGAIFGELFAMSYDWVGLSQFVSTLLAGVTLGATQVAIEFKDGFSPYGYSFYDALAGTLGGFYAMGKRFVPAMQYIDYKFTYWPNSSLYWDSTRKHGGEQMGGKLTGGDGVFVDDYYGGNQTHWISFKVAKMLPKSAKTNYPEWLAFAFGWGIDDGHYTVGWGKSRYEFYASLDYDLEAVFNPQKTWSKNLVKILNFVKFPAPAVRFDGRDGPKFFPLHPLHGFYVIF